MVSQHSPSSIRGWTPANPRVGSHTFRTRSRRIGRLFVASVCLLNCTQQQCPPNTVEIDGLCKSSDAAARSTAMQGDRRAPVRAGTAAGSAAPPYALATAQVRRRAPSWLPWASGSARWRLSERRHRRCGVLKQPRLGHERGDVISLYTAGKPGHDVAQVGHRIEPK